MVKKKKGNYEKKKRHPIRIVISLALIPIAGFLIFIVSTDFITTMKLKSEISNSDTMITNLDISENDTNYVRRFARGNYLVSKPGDHVFKMPSKNDDTDN